MLTLQRAVGLGYQSDWAKVNFPSRRERNEFYTQVGRALIPGPAGLTLLRELAENPDPEGLLSLIAA